jgi:transposase-like protein
MGHDPSLKETAIRLYLEGNTFRGVGRVLSVNFQSVINWVNRAHDELPHHVEDQTPTENVEIDELFTFVGKKRSKPTL